MSKTLKERNQMECNKKARKEYNKKNYKNQTVTFKISEMENIEAYCGENNIPKNTLIRNAVMLYIGKL